MHWNWLVKFNFAGVLTGDAVKKVKYVPQLDRWQGGPDIEAIQKNIENDETMPHDIREYLLEGFGLSR